MLWWWLHWYRPSMLANDWRIWLKNFSEWAWIPKKLCFDYLFVEMTFSVKCACTIVLTIVATNFVRAETDVENNAVLKRGNLRRLDDASAHWCHAFGLISKQMNTCTPHLPSWVNVNADFTDLIVPENLPPTCQHEFLTTAGKEVHHSYAPLPLSEQQLSHPLSTEQSWHPVCVVTTARGLFRTPWMAEYVPAGFWKNAVECGGLVEYFQCLIDVIQVNICKNTAIVGRHPQENIHQRTKNIEKKGTHGLDCVDCHNEVIKHPNWVRPKAKIT